MLIVLIPELPWIHFFASALRPQGVGQKHSSHHHHFTVATAACGDKMIVSPKNGTCKNQGSSSPSYFQRTTKTIWQSFMQCLSLLKMSKKKAVFGICEHINS